MHSVIPDFPLPFSLPRVPEFLPLCPPPFWPPTCLLSSPDSCPLHVVSPGSTEAEALLLCGSSRRSFGVGHLVSFASVSPTLLSNPTQDSLRTTEEREQGGLREAHVPAYVCLLTGYSPGCRSNLHLTSVPAAARILFPPLPSRRARTCPLCQELARAPIPRSPALRSRSPVGRLTPRFCSPKGGHLAPTCYLPSENLQAGLSEEKGVFLNFSFTCLAFLSYNQILSEKNGRQTTSTRFLTPCFLSRGQGARLEGTRDLPSAGTYAACTHAHAHSKRMRCWFCEV